jgi:5'-3' exonuclease
MKSLMLIDLSAIFWTSYHATANTDASAAFELTVGKVHQLAGQADLTAVCCDAPPYARRKALLESYKANREAAPPMAIGQLQKVKERLAADGFPLWDVQGFESDDVIATACKLAAAETEPLEVIIASGDKDLAQLVDDTLRVSWLSTIDGVRRDAKAVSEKFGVPPQLIRDYLALMGDKGDNVPGIPGVGKVNAVKLLEKFGDLEGVLAGAEEIATPALKKNVIEHADAARLAAQLVSLATDVPIDFDAVFAERKPKPLTKGPTPDELDAAGDEEEEDPFLDEVMGNAPAAPAPPPPPPAPAFTPAPPPPAPAAERTQLAIGKKNELVLRGPVPTFDMALQPKTIGQVAQIAIGIANSRMYTKFQNEDAITAVILRGRELGLSMMTSLDVFHVVEGKPVLHAHLIIDRARRHHECEYFRFVGGDDTYAEWECKHRLNPEPTKLRYTIEQAKRAGLCPENPRERPALEGGRDRRGNWEKRPDEMLRKMCGVQLARIDFPGAALGLYAVEELAPDHETVGVAA